MAHGRPAWEVYFSFSTHLVFYIHPTERRVLFIISYWRRAQVDLRSTSLCEVIFIVLLSALSRLYWSTWRSREQAMRIPDFIFSF